jgi:hypothetical protein
MIGQFLEAWDGRAADADWDHAGKMPGDVAGKSAAARAPTMPAWVLLAVEIHSGKAGEGPGTQGTKNHARVSLRAANINIQTKYNE